VLLPGADQRDSILSLNLLFFAGGYLLWRVDVEAGGRAAREMEDGYAR